MTRLTEADKLGGYKIKGVNTDDLTSCVDTILVENAIEKLAEYENLEEQNRLITLPYAVGSTVYVVINLYGERIIREHVCENIVDIVYDMQNGDFGKTVFLTREDAKAALRERQGE